MSRIHPSYQRQDAAAAAAASPPRAAVYTVWKRSSMGFPGTDGFSVYDHAGTLAFRVDNYSRRRKLFSGDLLLMDGHGSPLLALTPQIISMHDQWNCYRASEDGHGKRIRSQQLFSMRKCSVMQSSHEAEVHMSGCTNASSDRTGHVPGFSIEGSFRRRSCKIRNSSGEEVARIMRKKAGAASLSLTLAEDVFSLEVQPKVDCAMIMAFVIVLDRICWKPYTPMICSSLWLPPSISNLVTSTSLIKLARMRRIQIHPSSRGAGGGSRARRQAAAADQPVVYTVWKRSSIGFQGTDGFSVYDSAGKLAFRVDNYSRRRKAFAGDLLLMDGHGTPLLSLRPQILSLHNRWNCYRAQEEEGLDSTNSPSVSQQVFSMRKSSVLQSIDEAEVLMSTRPSDHSQPDASPSPSFRIEGCFSMRSCKIRGSNGEEAARITKKNAGVMSRPVSLGDDVFTLVVRPGVDVAVVMAMVVVMDRICRRPYTPMACSSSGNSVVHSGEIIKSKEKYHLNRNENLLMMEMKHAYCLYIPANICNNVLNATIASKQQRQPVVGMQAKQTRSHDYDRSLLGVDYLVHRQQSQPTSEGLQIAYRYQILRSGATVTSHFCTQAATFANQIVLYHLSKIAASAFK
uniref:Tubby C-terminal domain-containing protein n=1 Tax=Oryza punctata TaxID=4537 RepID=A0A0E0MJ03_ORYPU